jgi:hypothetical protein
MSIGNEIKSDLTQWYDNIETPLPQGDWNEFKGKLDQKYKKRALIRRYVYILLATFVVSMITITAVYISKDKTTATTQNPAIVQERQTLPEKPAQIQKEITLSGSNQNKPTVTVERNSLDQKNKITAVTLRPVKPAAEIVKNNNITTKNEEVANAIPIEMPAQPIIEKPIQQPTEANKQEITDTINLANEIKKPDVVVTNPLKSDSAAAPQNNETKKSSNPTKIACKIVFSPDYTIGKSTTNSADAPKIHENYNLINNESEKAAISFSLGVNLEFFVMKNLSITSGLFYDKYSTGGKYDFYNNEIPVIDSLNKTILGYITVKDSVGVHYSINNNYSFLELPLILNYYIPFGEKWKLNLKAGGSMLYYLSSSGKTISANLLVLKDVNTYSYNTINWGLILGLGCYYRISDKINIGLEPTYKQFFGSVMKNDQLTNMKPWSVGVNLNVQIKLK